MAESLKIIKKTQALYPEQQSTNPLPSLNGQCLLTPIYRENGVGVQAMIRICVMFLARQSHALYVHLPFLKLEHKEIDPSGRDLTENAWAAKWESFFNLGQDELHITDLAKVMATKPWPNNCLRKNTDSKIPKMNADTHFLP